MKTTLVLATTKTDLLDSQPDFGFYRFGVSDQPPVDTALPTAIYDLTPGATYSASAQAFAADGTPLDASVLTSFTVPAAPPPRTFEAPSGLSVTFG